MHQFYAIDKKTEKLTFTSGSLLLLKEAIKNICKTEEDFIITEDVDMKYLSRIVYVDGECVYNNKKFWLNTAPTLIEDFADHVVLDFMLKPVDLDRFKTEYNSNVSRLSAIDGVAGEVDYNITVGSEFISLFREECIFTDFETISPLQIAQKLLAVISLVQTGSFREAKAVLKTVENDEFLTEERIQKYIDMLDAADVIEYATEENHYDKVEETEEPAEEDK